MGRLKHWIAVFALGLLAGCGGSEGTERPEDCEAQEYYDEVDEVCRACPAVVEPECLEGCGVEVVEDARNCPVLQCQPGCPGCDDDEQWDEEQQSCV